MKSLIKESSSQTLLLETAQSARRRFIRQAGSLTFSGVAVALLGGRSIALAAGTADDAVQQDIRILNTAIAAEHEAVAAYQVGAESGLLETATLKVAVTFQGHHKEHVDALVKAVRSLGGQDVHARASYDFPVAKLKKQADVLQFAAGLERGAVSAYAGAIPVFGNRDLSAAAASILADEAMHWAVLRNALGMNPVPGAFFS
jgi:rubrerythrin